MLRVEDEAARGWYMNEAVEQSWIGSSDGFDSNKNSPRIFIPLRRFYASFHKGPAPLMTIMELNSIFYMI